MTLEISFLDSNIYEVLGLRSLLCQQYNGNLEEILFLSGEDQPSKDRPSIIFREDVVTMNLPFISPRQPVSGSVSSTLTWHIPFLSRKCSVDDLSIKIRKLLGLASTAAGLSYTDNMLKFRNYTQLSDTEYQVMILIGQGMNRQDISKVLNRSEKTISTHYRNISRKMGATNRAEFYRYAFFISRHGGERCNTLFL